jgi:hypothetical protein
MDDKGVPNPKNQTNDFGEDMDMKYTRLMKKKEWKMEDDRRPILEDQMN